MRKISIEKLYTDECNVRYDMIASNVANVYVNNSTHFPPQRHIIGDEEADMDTFVRETFNKTLLTWLRKVTTYLQENPNRDDIPFGVNITCKETPTKVDSYIIEYVGRKYKHEGIVADRIDWERALYEEWQSKYSPKNK